MTIAEIVKENECLGGSHGVVPGMALQVTHPSPYPPRAPPANWTKADKQYWQTYLVQAGDTLYTIAQEFDMDYNLLCQQNNYNCNTFGVLIQTGDMLTIPKQSCPPPGSPPGTACIQVPADSPGSKLKNMPFPMGTFIWGYSEEGATMPAALGAANFGGVTRDEWSQNEFMAEWAQNLYNLNAPNLASTQFYCTPGKPCIKAQCESVDDLLTGSFEDQPPFYDGFNGCHVFPSQTIAVPDIPCIPGNSYACFSITEFFDTIATSKDFFYAVVETGQYVLAATWDNQARAVMSILPQPDQGHFPAASAQVRVPIRLPGPDGYPKLKCDCTGPFSCSGFNKSGELCQFTGDYAVSSQLDDYFCEDLPGINGHHCYKLVADFSDPTTPTYN